jgi:hypothetical protein
MSWLDTIVPYTTVDAFSGAGCGSPGGGGDEPFGSGIFFCVPGAVGDLPSPGPDTEYSPGSTLDPLVPCPIPAFPSSGP